MNDLTTEMKLRIKSKLGGEKPTVWIGKNGVSQKLLKEIEKQLEKREMIKVKVLRSALESEEAEGIASQVAEKIEASIAEVRGHTFMLYSKQKK